MESEINSDSPNIYFSAKNEGQSLKIYFNLESDLLLEQKGLDWQIKTQAESEQKQLDT